MKKYEKDEHYKKLKSNKNAKFDSDIDDIILDKIMNYI